MLSRILNIVLVALFVALGILLLLPRLRVHAVPAPPSFAELDRAARARLAAGAPDAAAALERAQRSLEDRGAAELYGRGIELLRAGRKDLAEAAFSSAAREEDERVTEW